MVIKNLVLPRIASFQFGDEPMNFGEPASVQCTLSAGDWPINVTWMFNGVDIPPQLNVVTTKFTKHIYVLAIESVSEKNAGNYTCIAQNKAGKAVHTANLTVIGLFYISVI